MQRYFIATEHWDGEEITIKNDDAHHIHRVMRNKVDDEIICNHPNKSAAICRITQITEHTVTAVVKEWLQADAELPVNVTLVQSLPKGSKLELILQKGTELGATSFLLYQSDRSIVKWDAKKVKSKMTRFDKIVKEASEQCHRNVIPGITYTPSLKEILNQLKQTHTHLLFAYEEEARTRTGSRFGEALSKVQPGENIAIFIGPEGGFTEEEAALFSSYEAKSVRLGTRILRTETAGLYALASISYHFEEACNE